MTTRSRLDRALTYTYYRYKDLDLSIFDRFTIEPNGQSADYLKGYVAEK